MTISSQAAIEAARQDALARGWAWKEPIRAHLSRAFVLFGQKRYEVLSNADMRGSNCRFVIDAEHGTVLEAYWLPR